MLAVDQGDIGALVLLDLSAAFDTVDHTVLIDVLRDRFAVEGNALSWMASYLEGRSHVVTIGSSKSTARFQRCGVPQGSVLGPKQFIAYTEDVVDIYKKHAVSHHGYADDMQGFKRCHPCEIRPTVMALEQSSTEINSWSSSRRLQLNAQKTELIWFGSSTNLSRLNPEDMKLHFGGNTVEPSDVVRNLGVYFDSELTMRSHVSRVTRSCFHQLRRLRSIRRQLGCEVTKRLVSAFVLSRLDYCNAILAELPSVTLAPLQRVQNAAARLVLGLRYTDHITPALIKLHWLPVRQHISYKLCMLVHKSLAGQAPSYLSELCHLVSENPFRAVLRSADSRDLIIPQTELCIGDRAFSVAGARSGIDCQQN